VDGNAALETVRELGRFHRVHGSPQLAGAAQLVATKLLVAGLADAAVEHFPADGKTRVARTTPTATAIAADTASQRKRRPLGERAPTASIRPI